MLRPAILWNDQRTAAECDLIRAAVGPERLDRDHRQRRPHRPDRAEARLGPRPRARHLARGSRTSCCPRTTCACGSPATTRWTRPTAPARCCSISPRATGRPRCWPRCEIDRAWLPPTYRGPGRHRRVTAEAAAAHRPGRGHAGRGRRRRPVGQRGRRRRRRARGRGAVARHVGRRLRRTDRPLYEPHGRVHAFCHAVPGRWHMMSVMLSAAGSLRWFRDALAPGVEFGALVGRGRGGAGRQRRPLLPALPVGRAQPASGSAGPRRLRRPDAEPRPPAHDARRAGGRGLRPARRAGADGRRRACPAPPDARLGRRPRQPAVAPDPGRRARGRDRDPSTRRARPTARPCWRPSARAGSRPSTRRAPRWSARRPSPRPGRTARYAEVYATYRALYPALAPSFRQM